VITCECLYQSARKCQDIFYRTVMTTRTGNNGIDDWEAIRSRDLILYCCSLLHGEYELINKSVLKVTCVVSVFFFLNNYLFCSERTDKFTHYFVSTKAGILGISIHLDTVWGFSEGLGSLLFHTRVFSRGWVKMGTIWGESRVKTNFHRFFCRWCMCSQVVL